MTTTPAVPSTGPGRPLSAEPAVIVSCRIPQATYDAICQKAISEGVSVHKVIVRVLETADLHHLLVFP